MSPLRSSAGSAFTDATSAAARVRLDARLRGFPAEAHLDEDAEALPGRRRRAVEPPGEVQRVDRLDDGGDLRGAIRLVRLDRADEMSRGIGRQMRKFLLRLLDAVLAERADAGRVRRGGGRRADTSCRPRRGGRSSFARPLRAAAAAMRPLHVGDARGDLLRPRHGAVTASSRPGAGRIERAVREGVRLAVLLARDVDDAEAFDPARLPPRLLEEARRGAAPSCGTRRRTGGGRAGCRRGSRRPRRPRRARGRGPRESRAIPRRCSSSCRAVFESARPAGDQTP